MPLKIEILANTPDELYSMLAALQPLLSGANMAAPDAPVAVLNSDGQVAAFATTTTVASKKRTTKKDAPTEPTAAGSEDPQPEEGLDAPAAEEAPATAQPSDLLKEAIDNARVLFARGKAGSERIASLRAKYNPDPANKKFKFDEVPADRIADFHADVAASLDEIAA